MLETTLAVVVEPSLEKELVLVAETLLVEHLCKSLELVKVSSDLIVSPLCNLLVETHNRVRKSFRIVNTLYKSILDIYL